MSAHGRRRGTRFARSRASFMARVAKHDLYLKQRERAIAERFLELVSRADQLRLAQCATGNFNFEPLHQMLAGEFSELDLAARKVISERLTLAAMVDRIDELADHLHPNRFSREGITA